MQEKQLYRFLGTRLSDRERTVSDMRYGLSGGQAYTQREVADRLGISRSYVSRIEKHALSQLRKAYESSGDA